MTSGKVKTSPGGRCMAVGSGVVSSANTSLRLIEGDGGGFVLMILGGGWSRPASLEVTVAAGTAFTFLQLFYILGNRVFYLKFDLEIIEMMRCLSN